VCGEGCGGPSDGRRATTHRCEQGRGRYSFLEMFVATAIAIAIFIAVLPSVSAARRLPHKHGPGTYARPTHDAIDALIRRLPTSCFRIGVVSLAVATVVAGSVPLFRGFVRRRPKRCQFRASGAQSAQEADNPYQPPGA